MKTLTFAVFFILFAVCVGTVGFTIHNLTKRDTNSNALKKYKKVRLFASVGAVIFFVLLLFVPSGIVEIKTGEIGVVSTFGKVKGTKQPGLSFVNALTTKVRKFDTKVQQLEIETEVYTKDAQPSTISIVVQYRIDDTRIMEIAKTYGNMDNLNSRFSNIVIEKAKVVLADKTAMVLIETRIELSPNVQTSIESVQNKYFVFIESAIITDMAFSDAFESAVENKMIAEQRKLEAQYAKEQAIIKAEEEARTAEIKAEADLAVAILNAQKAIEKAKGDADAQVAIAQGQAKALKLQYIETARMLGLPITETEISDDEGNIIGYNYNIDASTCSEQQYEALESYMRYINYLDTWDGKLPTVIGDGETIGGIII